MNNISIFNQILPLKENEKIKQFDITNETIYLISSLGRIFSIYGREKKANLNKKRGYMYVRTENGNKILHRLVAEAFLPKEQNKEYINHKNGVKTDNRLENLEWCTAIENAQHAIKMGLTKKIKKNEGKVVFTNDQVKRVVKLIKEKGWSYQMAGKTEGMSYSTVAHIMTGRRRQVEGIKQYEKNKNN